MRAGCRFFFGYPITPQTELAAYMAKKLPTIGGTFLQAESEIAAINMVYGAAAAGARVMTSSSSPGVSLKGEGVSYMAGADAWNSDPTDGKLRYLNLWNAELKMDTRWSYNNDDDDEYTDADNKVGDYLFENCTALETVILPKSVTYIGENVFDTATGLKRVAVGRNTTEVECDILQDLDDYGGIDELVFLTNQHVTSDYSDPWEAPIQKVYVPRSQMGDYMSDDKLSSRAQSISSLFDDDHILFRTADYGGLFFRPRAEGLLGVPEIPRREVAGRQSLQRLLEHEDHHAARLCGVHRQGRLQRLLDAGQPARRLRQHLHAGARRLQVAAIGLPHLRAEVDDCQVPGALEPV